MNRLLITHMVKLKLCNMAYKVLCDLPPSCFFSLIVAIKTRDWNLSTWVHILASLIGPWIKYLTSLSFQFPCGRKRSHLSRVLKNLRFYSACRPAFYGCWQNAWDSVQRKKTLSLTAQQMEQTSCLSCFLLSSRIPLKMGMECCLHNGSASWLINPELGNSNSLKQSL